MYVRRWAKGKILAAAALHDTIEDTETTPNELIAECGGPPPHAIFHILQSRFRPGREHRSQQNRGCCGAAGTLYNKGAQAARTIGRGVCQSGSGLA